MEKVREVKSHNKPVGIDSDIPSAPTLEDFYFDPGIAGQDSQAFQDPLGVNPFSAQPITDGIQRMDFSDQSKHNFLTLTL